MAIGKAERAAYNAAIKHLKADIKEFNKSNSSINLKKRKMPNIAGYLNIENASIYLKKIAKHIEMSDISLRMLDIKNEKELNEGRKEFYKVLQAMEEAVGDEIDRPLNENEEYLGKIDKFTPKDIINLLLKMSNSVKKLKDKFGEKSKWKWSFIELSARVSVIAKNITNFSNVDKYRDPRSEFYHEMKELMNFCKDNLTESAKQYRMKYEVAGKAREDLKKSIEFLSAQRKIHIIFRETEEANKIKITIDALKQALKSEDKSKDKNSKKQKK